MFEKKKRTPKIALITGITGQDGIYVAELLLNKGYVVHGLCRRAAYRPETRLEPLQQRFGAQLQLHMGDMTDSMALCALLTHVQPHEIYHLAAQSDVAVSFEIPLYTMQTNALGTLCLLDALRIIDTAKKIRFYQASSSEMFGKAATVPQNELTPFYPRSPYGISKVSAYWTAVNYREAYDMFVCNGILFNHESPLRGDQFVTQKIVRSFAKWVMGEGKVLSLGNLYAQRDWGYTPEYAQAMWLMLQQERPDDYVIATGKSATVRTFVEYVAVHAGIPLQWRGTGLAEEAVDDRTGKVVIRIDAALFRPTEVDLLLGDATKAQQKLGWTAKTTVYDLARIMLEAALARERSHTMRQYQQGSATV